MARQAQLQPAGVRAAERRSQIIDALLAQQMQPKEIVDPWQGLAQMGGSIALGLMSSRANRDLDQAHADAAQQRQAKWQALASGQQPAPQVPPPSPISAPPQPGLSAGTGGGPVVDALAGQEGVAPAGANRHGADGGVPSLPSQAPGFKLDPVTLAMLGDPEMADLGEAMALEQFKHQFADPPKPMEIEGKLVDPTTGKVIGDYSKPPDWQNPEWVKTQQAIRAAGRPNIALNVDARAQGKGLEKAYELGAVAWDAAREAATRADRDEPMLQGIEQAMEGFRPGATADLRLRANQVLKDIGLNVEGVPEGEMFKMLSNRLQLAAAPKGQGQITEFERSLIAQTVPLIGTSPEGNAQIINMIRKLNDFDRKAAQIYRESARKNGGVPNPLEVSESLTQLGPALNANEMGLLQTAASGGAAPAASPAPAATPAAPAGLPPGAPEPPPGFVIR